MQFTEPKTYDEYLAVFTWWRAQGPERRARWLTVSDGPLSAWGEMVRRKGRLPRTDGRETR